MGKNLAAIIAQSRAVMEKSDEIIGTDNGSQSSQQRRPPASINEENGETYLTEAEVQSKITTGDRPTATPNISNTQYKEKLSQSNLPDSIKAIMNETSYGLDVDLGVDISGATIKPQTPTRQPIMETQQSGPNYQGLDESQIRAIVNDELTNFLATYFTKTLTENVQKDLIMELKKRQLKHKKKVKK